MEADPSNNAPLNNNLFASSSSAPSHHHSVLPHSDQLNLNSISPGADGARFYTIQRVNGNGANGKGDGTVGAHRHTIEESDRIKKNSIHRHFIKEEKERRKSHVRSKISCHLFHSSRCCDAYCINLQQRGNSISYATLSTLRHRCPKRWYHAMVISDIPHSQSSFFVSAYLSQRLIHQRLIYAAFIAKCLTRVQRRKRTIKRLQDPPWPP